MDLLFEIVKLAAVGLTAGLFSSYLGGRDHRQRKWWEMRVAAYQSVIEALSDLVYYYEQGYDAELHRREWSEDMQKKMAAIWDTNFSKVRRAADSGAFLFSAEANEAMSEFVQQGEYVDSFDYYDTKLSKSKKCLSALVGYSKTDLQLQHNRWNLFPSW